MAQSGFTFDVRGFDAIAHQLKTLPASVVDKEVQTIMMHVGKSTRDAMKQIVNYNNDPERDDRKKHLRDQIKFKRGRMKKRAIDVWLGVQNTRFSRAPHWHLVAYGTGQRAVDSYKKSPKTKLITRKKDGTKGANVRMGVAGMGEIRFITQTGKMPANPYAERAMAATGGSVGQAMTADVNKYLVRKADALARKYGKQTFKQSKA